MTTRPLRRAAPIVALIACTLAAPRPLRAATLEHAAPAGNQAVVTGKPFESQ